MICGALYGQVFYLEEALPVHAGDLVKGRLKCTPNERNPRDLDITISFSLDGKRGAAAATHFYRMR